MNEIDEIIFNRFLFLLAVIFVISILCWAERKSYREIVEFKESEENEKK